MELDELRVQIDETDAQLLALFRRRMALCAQIGAYKKAEGLPVYQPQREEEKLSALTASLCPQEAQEVRALFRELFALSRARQERL